MNNIKVIVIDDDKAMHIVMKRLLSEISEVDLVGCYYNASQALQYLQHDNIDLVFIDIMIGQDHGLEVARRLRESHSEMDIVFVTSHKEYAIDSFDSYPLDYMIKPISKSRLEQTIVRAAARRGKPSMDQKGKLLVRALGDFEVRNPQVGPAKWISKRSMELFAYLLLQKGRPVLKSRIIEHIYPDIPQKNAATYVNTNVYQLRKTLDSLGLKENIIHSQEQYWLLLDEIDADFIQFEEQISQLDTIDSHNIDKAMTVESMYTGQLFEDRSYEWAISEQIRLHQRYTQFAKQLSRSLLTHQRVEQAVSLIKKLLLNDEWDEEVNLMLLSAYMESKDYAAFKQHYDHISSLYESELSVPLPVEFLELQHDFFQAIQEKEQR